MVQGLKEFGEIAKKLSVNPLGIIALFIVLVYGIAALVLGISADTLKPFERLPIIWFLVVFPPIVLFTFAWLVAKHHGKLYAPKDFSDPTQFLQTLNRDVQVNKLIKEVKSIENNESNNSENVKILSHLPRKEIMTRVLISEDLVLRELSSEYGSNISRQMGIGDDIGIDGMFSKNGKGYGVEVKFIRQIPNVINALKSLEDITSRINYYGWKNFNIILAAVIDDTSIKDIDKVKSNINNYIESNKLNISVKYFIFSELLSKYEIEI